MELNPFSYDFHENPYPTYRWLRDEAPLYRNEALDFYALSRFRDVVAASNDWGTYSSAEGTTIERLAPEFFDLTPMMIFLDPPRHDRLRRLVSRVFTPRRVAELEPFIRATALSMLEPLVERGGGDFVREFSQLLPMEVIFTMLGVPAGDRAELREWIDQSLAREPDSPAVPERGMEATANILRYWFGLVAALRRQPTEGVISGLLEAEVEGDDGAMTRLTDGEIVGFCMLLGAAGSETVTRVLANAIVLFGRYPSEYGKILGAPALIPNAVEEIVRYYSPSHIQGRSVMRDVEWYGQRVPRGARIMLLTAAANRDEREFADPDRFDIERRVSTALGFGQGVHFCLGASLARLESRVALEEFSRRFPRYRVDEGRTVRVHMSSVHGYESVPFGV